jgi:hypothetical protein
MWQIGLNSNLAVMDYKTHGKAVARLTQELKDRLKDWRSGPPQRADHGAVGRRKSLRS